MSCDATPNHTPTDSDIRPHRETSHWAGHVPVLRSTSFSNSNYVNHISYRLRRTFGVYKFSSYAKAQPKNRAISAAIPAKIMLSQPKTERFTFHPPSHAASTIKTEKTNPRNTQSANFHNSNTIIHIPSYSRRTSGVYKLFSCVENDPKNQANFTQIAPNPRFPTSPDPATLSFPLVHRRLFLIDSYGFIFRAYHARARTKAAPMRTSTGISTEAVFIFNNMIRKLAKSFEPEYMAAIFESIGKTKREEEFADYKANRAEMPPDLPAQIAYVRQVLGAMNIPILQFAGYEADDVIGTISRRAAEQGFDVIIVSSDKDMLQLVNDHVRMLNPAKDDLIYDAVKVKEFMGVEPHLIADYLALTGDTVDNIPARCV